MARSKDEYSKKEAAKRRDEALRRALMTPPKPHVPKPKRAKKKQKQNPA